MKLLSISTPTSLPMQANRAITYRSGLRSNPSRGNDELFLRPIAVIRASGPSDYSGSELVHEKGKLVDLYV